MKEKQDQDDKSQDQAFTQQQQDIMAKMLDDRDQKWKSEIEGLNRRNNQLDKALKEKEVLLDKLKKEKLSEEEQFKMELDKRDQEITTRERELTIKTNREKAMKYATENDIPMDLLELVPMSDEAAMMTSLEKVKSVVDGDRASTLEGQKKRGGDKPRAGSTTQPKTGISRKSDFESIDQEMAWVKEHGQEAYNALPD